MTVLIKGAGDLASGVAVRLKASGFSVVMTETHQPTTVRRTVAFSRVVYETTACVEDYQAELTDGLQGIESVLQRGNIAVIIDPDAKILKDLRPDVLIDAILAKQNLGTSINDAPTVIALGPGFYAGTDCHAVIETMRGHFLGKTIYQGSALPNTGIPGDIGGYTKERIIRSPCSGIFHPLSSIGDQVAAGDAVAQVDDQPVLAAISGTIRGLLQDGVSVTEGMKSGDIDSRCKKEYCFSISDKARSIGGGVLEAILHFSNY